MKLPSLFARETGTDRLARLHALFIIYNGAVVLLLAGAIRAGVIARSMVL